MPRSIHPEIRFYESIFCDSVVLTVSLDILQYKAPLRSMTASHVLTCRIDLEAGPMFQLRADQLGWFHLLTEVGISHGKTF